MNRFAAGLSLGLILPLVANAFAPDEGTGARYRGGEVLVKYRGQAAGSAAVAMKRALGLWSLQSMLDGRLELVGVPSPVDVPAVIAMLQDDPAVEYAEPNFYRRPLAAPSPATNDPLLSQQWGVQNTGQPNFVDGGPAGTPGADMNLVNAWYLGGTSTPDHTGTGSIVVALIDDAVETTHPDLAPNLSLPGYNASDRNGNVDPTPGASPAQSHGTAVAGCIAAVGNNGIGVTGAAWNEKILPIKFDFTLSSEVTALDYARTHGARIVNASFGSPSYTQTEYDAISRLNDAGILLVTAAGNENSNLDISGASFPANYQLPNIIAVAATNRQDGIASFSTYGPVTIPVAAPGLQIVTTTVGGGYTTGGISGTSFSSPYTAGVSALIEDYDPSASIGEVKGRLVEGADAGLDTANPVNRRAAGGRLDAANSLALAARPSIVMVPVRTGSYAGSFAGSLGGASSIPVYSAVDDGAGHVVNLEAGATSTIRVTLQDLWQSADGVTATLSATGGGVIVDDATPAVFGAIASGGEAAANFSVSVPAGTTGHQYVYFALAISANGGTYTATRHFTLEIGQLQAGTPITQTIQTDLYDEFHTWHYDVTPDAAGRPLRFQTTAANDIDILVSYAAPAQYDIELSASPDDDNRVFFTSVPDSQVGAAKGGNESVTIDHPQAGTYYVTVINFDQAANATYTLSATQDVAADDAGHHGGGGSAGPWTLALLSAAQWLRRRRKTAAFRRTAVARKRDRTPVRHSASSCGKPLRT